MYDGHRQRLRDRFEQFGPDSLKDHELLELLLFFSIPRRNTNAIAHELISRFGSLSAVLAAPLNELNTVEGIGDASALFLCLVNEIARRARMTSIAKTPLNTLGELCDYCCELLAGERSEQFCVILMDARFNLIRTVRLSAGIPDSVAVYPRLIAEQALKSGAMKVTLVHNHPAGDCTPSPDDIRTTDSVAAALAPLGIDLVDHIIVTDSEAYALRAQKKTDFRPAGYHTVLSQGCGLLNPCSVAEYLRRLDGALLDEVIALLESAEGE